MRILGFGLVLLVAISSEVVVFGSEAQAVVCARGVRGAACAGPAGAAVVRRPAVVCRTVIVNGAAVRRCG